MSLTGSARATETDDEIVDAELADPRPGPEATLAQKQDVAALDNALAALPPTYRECLILREVELLSYKEIARITRVPIGTVMSRLWRAREALRNDACNAAPNLAPENERRTAAMSRYGEASGRASR